MHDECDTEKTRAPVGRRTDTRVVAGNFTKQGITAREINLR
jgi:hypothetical protein